MNYITAKEIADKWGISRRRVQILCEQGKIKGVSRLGRTWAIPKDAVKPIDRRYKHKAAKKIENQTR